MHNPSTRYHVPHSTDPDGIALHDPDARSWGINDPPTVAQLADTAERAAAAYLAAVSPSDARPAAELAAALAAAGAGPAVAVLDVYPPAVARAQSAREHRATDRGTVRALARRAWSALALLEQAIAKPTPRRRRG